MTSWAAEPLYETLDRLRAVHQLAAGDTLTLILREQARLPVQVRRDYRGLDKLKSLMGQGIIGVIVR
jgi:hypothetical protein